MIRSRKSFLILAFIASSFLGLMGCGDGGNTVIAPGSEPLYTPEQIEERTAANRARREERQKQIKEARRNR